MRFVTGAADTPRVLACIAGDGQLEHGGGLDPFREGDLLLLAAEVGACRVIPHTAVNMLELALPEGP